MKKLVRFICLILTCSLTLVVPAQAESVVEPRASAFFASYGTDLYKTSSSSFQIWFDVTANAGNTMQVLGVREIILYRSADQQTWQKMKIYKMESYSCMVAQNTTSHGGYVSYNFADTGYYYTAYITFYAKNSSGIAERYVYTEILRM